MTRHWPAASLAFCVGTFVSALDLFGVGWYMIGSELNKDDNGLKCLGTLILSIGNLTEQDPCMLFGVHGV